MDINNLKGLMEAYQQVNAPEQIDEVLDTPEKANEYARKNVKSMVGAFVKGAVNKDISQLKTIEKRKRGAELGKRKAERKAAEEQKESFDIFDVVLEFLQVEGYAETLEEAEWMMANVIDEKAVAIILEAMHEDEDEEDEKEMKKGKKSKKEEEDDEDEDEEELDEALTGERYKKVMKKPGGTAYSRKVSADPAKRATRGGRGGESDFGAGDRGSGNKAARRAGTYQEEEFAIDEAIYSEKGKAKAAEMIAKRSTPSGRAKSGKGANVAQIRQIRGSGRGSFDREGLGGTPMTPTMAKNPIKKQNYIGTGNKAARRAGTYQEAFEAWLDEAMTNYEKNRKRAAQRAAARNDARAQGKTGAVPGVGYVTPRKERETWTDESGKTRHAKGL